MKRPSGAAAEKLPISMRYRPVAEVDPGSAHASPSMKLVGNQKVDDQIQMIQQSVGRLRATEAKLQHCIMEFTANTGHNIGCIGMALANLGHLLAERQWHLERPRRYKLQLIVSECKHNPELETAVAAFNCINELCSELIHQGTDLQEVISQFLIQTKVVIGADKTRTTGGPLLTSGAGAYILNPSAGVSLSEAEREMNSVREEQTNINRAKQLEMEAIQATRTGRKLFNDIVTQCAIHLMQTKDG
ncbi:unnamed protein product [Dicrocoelium dendriticum]|nr:unnamed protein product [Dicrocoelium dendriticum]